jgi:hypothetical protein
LNHVNTSLLLGVLSFKSGHPHTRERAERDLNHVNTSLLLGVLSFKSGHPHTRERAERDLNHGRIVAPPWFKPCCRSLVTSVPRKDGPRGI